MPTLNPATIEILKLEVQRRGCAAVARELGLSAGALARALCSANVRPGTIAQINLLALSFLPAAEAR